MKSLLKIAVAVAALVPVSAAMYGSDRLVILHTNDTHSQIDPDDRDGLGGVARRKVLVDSVRRAEDNVLLVDAGDAVQGTLYFNLYGGEVEQKVSLTTGSSRWRRCSRRLMVSSWPRITTCRNRRWPTSSRNIPYVMWMAAA